MSKKAKQRVIIITKIYGRCQFDNESIGATQ